MGREGRGGQRKGAGRERGREGREREKGREAIGEGEGREGEWGSPTHYFRLKSCTAAGGWEEGELEKGRGGGKQEGKGEGEGEGLPPKGTAWIRQWVRPGHPKLQLNSLECVSRYGCRYTAMHHLLGDVWHLPAPASPPYAHASWIHLQNLWPP